MKLQVGDRATHRSGAGSRPGRSGEAARRVVTDRSSRWLRRAVSNPRDEGVAKDERRPPFLGTAGCFSGVIRVPSTQDVRLLGSLLAGDHPEDPDRRPVLDHLVGPARTAGAGGRSRGRRRREQPRPTPAHPPATATAARAAHRSGAELARPRARDAARAAGAEPPAIVAPEPGAAGDGRRGFRSPRPRRAARRRPAATAPRAGSRAARRLCGGGASRMWRTSGGRPRLRGAASARRRRRPRGGT
jgi:hypothetical protein